MRNDIDSMEAATILGVSQATFNRWAAKGDILANYKGRGVSGARLFKQADVEKLAKDRARARAKDGQPELGFDDDSVAQMA
jgi:DNA-binding transcriptional MerR regulator